MFKYDEKYRFTEQWFDPQIPNWEETFAYLKKEGSVFKDVLEVGCFEGRATVWLCENVLQEGANYDIVDTFGGTLEEAGMGSASELLSKDKDAIFSTFKHNTSFHSDRINFNIYRDYSQQALPRLVDQKKQYDFIYIDASHKADDTFVDAYYANKLLKPGGLIIFDDFQWKDPNKPHPVDSPELGVRMFFTMYEDRDYKVLFHGYQVGALKLK
jgi:predicted O-methyltransferase YrrM